MATNNQADIVSHGVQELIEELQKNGVDAGKEEGQRIIADAEARAKWIVDQAQAEAKALLQEAEKKASFVRDAGSEALKLAMRDVQLRLRDEISQHLAQELEQSISQAIDQPEALNQLLIGLATKLAGEEVPQAILIPAKVIGLDELRENPQALTEGQLPALLADSLQSLMRQGIEVLTSKDNERGCIIQFSDNKVAIHIDEETLTHALLQHLQPRFRDLLEGVIS
jgi:V/A-type H+-transporting ATPase subunit E